MSMTRKLVVVADDLGIGPETDRGILELACRGVVTATVLLVNSPASPHAAASWRKAGKPCDLGWHPCLTLDRPILSREKVPSLVDRFGNFWKLGVFLARWFSGLIRPEDVYHEWLAQLDRFRELTGADPVLVNTHQHIGILPPFSDILVRVLENLSARPWVRRVVESQQTKNKMTGAYVKRWLLCRYGKNQSGTLDSYGFPGARTMVGLTDPNSLKNDRFFEQCLRADPGNIVELMCHPGHLDTTLIGRDVSGHGAGLDRRPREYAMLASHLFKKTVLQCQFQFAKPSDWLVKRHLAC